MWAQSECFLLDRPGVMWLISARPGGEAAKQLLPEGPAGIALEHVMSAARTAGIMCLGGQPLISQDCYISPPLFLEAGCTPGLSTLWKCRYLEQLPPTLFVTELLARSAVQMSKHYIVQCQLGFLTDRQLTKLQVPAPASACAASRLNQCACLCHLATDQNHARTLITEMCSLPSTCCTEGALNPHTGAHQHSEG